MGANFEAAHFQPCLREYSDIKKMKFPELIIDWEKSNADYEMAQDAIGDILCVT